MINDGMLPYKQVNPRPVGPEVNDADSLVTSPPAQQKDVQELITPSLNS